MQKICVRIFLIQILDLLDICDDETRKLAAESEKRLVIKSDDESDISDYDSDSKRKLIIKKKKDIKKLKTLKHKKLTEKSFSESEDGSLGDISNSGDICHYSSDESLKEKKKSKGPTKKSKSLKTNKSDMEVDDDDASSNKNLSKTSRAKRKKIEKTEKLIISKENKLITPTKKAKVAFEKNDFVENDENVYSFSSGEESCSNFDEEEDSNFNEEEDSNFNEDEKEDDVWEDIYGRKRDKDGNVITENKQKYIPPAQRLKELENNAEKSEKQLLLRRQMKGLLNRLAESNMHAIISQVNKLIYLKVH